VYPWCFLLLPYSLVRFSLSACQWVSHGHASSEVEDGSQKVELLPPVSQASGLGFRWCWR
jgi:hypothetical protein